MLCVCGKKGWMLGGWKIGVVCNWESTDVNLIHGRINETHSLVCSTDCKLYVSRVFRTRGWQATY